MAHEFNSATTLMRELVNAAKAAYLKNPFMITEEMQRLLRAADKAEAFLRCDYEQLWIMEREDHQQTKASAKRSQPILSRATLTPAPAGPGPHLCDERRSILSGFDLDDHIDVCVPPDRSSAKQHSVLQTTPNLGPLLPSPLHANGTFPL